MIIQAHLFKCTLQRVQQLHLGLTVLEAFTVLCRAQGAAALVDTSINNLRHCYRAVLRQ